MTSTRRPAARRARHGATRSRAGGDSTSPPRSPAQRRDPAARQVRAERRRRRGRGALWGRTKRIEATLDFWDDQNDVYAHPASRAASPSSSASRGPAGTDTNLILWQPRTKHVDDLGSVGARRPTVGTPRSAMSGSRYRVPENGYLLRPGEARLTRRRHVQARDREGVSPLLVLEQLVVGHVPQAAGRVPDHHGSRQGRPSSRPRRRRRTPPRRSRSRDRGWHHRRSGRRVEWSAL